MPIKEVIDVPEQKRLNEAGVRLKKWDLTGSVQRGG